MYLDKNFATLEKSHFYRNLSRLQTFTALLQIKLNSYVSSRLGKAGLLGDIDRVFYVRTEGSINTCNPYTDHPRNGSSKEAVR